MSYYEAIEAAGAKIFEYKGFGSYQGDWWAKVEYKNKTGWIRGSYGSCSGCDSFEAEFGYESHQHGDINYYNPIYEGFKKDCSKCISFKQRLADFGEGYLDNIMTKEEAIKEASRYLEWDMEAEKVVDFIKEH